MNSGKTLFAQLMAWVPWTSFDRIVRRYQGDYGVRTFPCTEQFRAMAFVQLTWRESLRDLEACLAAHPNKLYGMGFRQPVRRSTLADALAEVHSINPMKSSSHAAFNGFWIAATAYTTSTPMR